MAERTLYQSAPVMRLYIAEHPFHYEMENLCRIFFPYHRIETIPCGTDGNGAHILDYGTLGAYTGMQTELGGIRLQARCCAASQSAWGRKRPCRASSRTGW